jgi:hypothetical protein
MKTKTLRVDYLARVEGEGGLYVKMKGGSVVDVKLKIFEPPASSRPSSAAATSPRLPTSRLAFAVSVR